MESSFDDKDMKILEVLRENSKLSTQMISKKTLIPITTVHYRIKKLRSEGVIDKYTIKINHKKLGKDVLAYAFFVPNYDVLKEENMHLEDIVEKIKKHPCVEEAAIITGFKDVLLKIRVKNIEELNNFVVGYLQKINEVSRTETLIVLKDLE